MKVDLNFALTFFALMFILIQEQSLIVVIVTNILGEMDNGWFNLGNINAKQSTAS